MRSLLTIPVVALVMGCAGSPAVAPLGTRVDIPEQVPELGPLEAEALGYLDHMTALLRVPNDDPQVTVVSVGRYLDENGDAIRANVRAIAERIDGMTRGERIYYEERFGELFAPAIQQWMEALQAFRDQHPEAAPRVDGLMIYFD